MRRYLRIWARMAAMSLHAQLSHGLGSLGFLLGKLIRLLFFFAYVVAVFDHTELLGGHTLAEMALFFLTFNIVDITTQIFFRGIYGARRAVVDGDLDTYLTQPCPPLLRLACQMVDFLDIVTLVPVLILMGITWNELPAGIGPAQFAAYALLLGNGLAIALGIHIAVAALAVRTQELDNAIWVYRDMMFLGKFPMDIYARPLQWALVTLLPIGVMCSFPAQALLGRLSPAWGAYALAFAALSLGSGLAFWRDSLRRYTSVSS